MCKHNITSRPLYARINYGRDYLEVPEQFSFKQSAERRNLGKKTRLHLFSADVTFNVSNSKTVRVNDAEERGSVQRFHKSVCAFSLLNLVYTPPCWHVCVLRPVYKQLPISKRVTHRLRGRVAGPF